MVFSVRWARSVWASLAASCCALPIAVIRSSFRFRYRSSAVSTAVAFAMPPSHVLLLSRSVDSTASIFRSAAAVRAAAASTAPVVRSSLASIRPRRSSTVPPMSNCRCS